MIGLIHWPHNDKRRRGRGRPYVYSPTNVILRCFIVRIWFRLDSNRALYQYLAMDLPYNRKVMKACGLSKLPPSRRTFDRRLATISRDIKKRILAMGELFVCDNLVDPYIVTTDKSTLLIKANGSVWHTSSMIEGVIIPRSAGIDTDARC